MASSLLVVFSTICRWCHDSPPDGPSSGFGREGVGVGTAQAQTTGSTVRGALLLWLPPGVPLPLTASGSSPGLRVLGSCLEESCEALLFGDSLQSLVHKEEPEELGDLLKL